MILWGRFLGGLSEKIPLVALGIIDGLNESILDAKGVHVEVLQKTVVYPVKLKVTRESLNMSQQEFSKAYANPLATLRNWEQGRRKLDMTAIAYFRFRAIIKFPQEVMSVQMV